MAVRLRVRPSKVGTRFLLLLLLVGFAAFNTKNNLLFLMFTAGLSAVLVSMASGWLALRRVRLALGEPSDFYAGAPSVEKVVATNESRWIDVYSITLRDLDFPGVAPLATLDRLRSRESAPVEIEKTYPHRGRFEGRSVRLSTAFPFGLCEVDRDVALERKLTVFPAVKRVDISYIFKRGIGTHPYRHQAGGSEDLFRIREYAVGDTLRHVDWKSTAKLARVMVKEFATEQQRRFCLILDNTAPGEPPLASDPLFETMVILAASLASHFASHHVPFRLVSAEVAFPLGSSEEHLRGVLTYLAGAGRSSGSESDLVNRVRDATEEEEVILALPGHFESPLFGLTWPGLHVISPSVLLRDDMARSA